MEVVSLLLAISMATLAIAPYLSNRSDKRLSNLAENKSKPFVRLHRDISQHYRENPNADEFFIVLLDGETIFLDDLDERFVLPKDEDSEEDFSTILHTSERFNEDERSFKQNGNQDINLQDCIPRYYLVPVKPEILRSSKPETKEARIDGGTATWNEHELEIITSLDQAVEIKPENNGNHSEKSSPENTVEQISVRQNTEFVTILESLRSSTSLTNPKVSNPVTIQNSPFQPRSSKQTTQRLSVRNENERNLEMNASEPKEEHLDAITVIHNAGTEKKDKASDTIHSSEMTSTASKGHLEIQFQANEKNTNEKRTEMTFHSSPNKNNERGEPYETIHKKRIAENESKTENLETNTTTTIKQFDENIRKEGETKEPLSGFLEGKGELDLKNMQLTKTDTGLTEFANQGQNMDAIDLETKEQFLGKLDEFRLSNDSSTTQESENITGLLQEIVKLVQEIKTQPMLSLSIHQQKEEDANGHPSNIKAVETHFSTENNPTGKVEPDKNQKGNSNKNKPLRNKAGPEKLRQPTGNKAEENDGAFENTRRLNSNTSNKNEGKFEILKPTYSNRPVRKPKLPESSSRYNRRNPARNQEFIESLGQNYRRNPTRDQELKETFRSTNRRNPDRNKEQYEHFTRANRNKSARNEGDREKTRERNRNKSSRNREEPNTSIEDTMTEFVKKENITGLLQEIAKLVKLEKNPQTSQEEDSVEFKPKTQRSKTKVRSEAKEDSKKLNESPQTQEKKIVVINHNYGITPKPTGVSAPQTAFYVPSLGTRTHQTATYLDIQKIPPTIQITDSVGRPYNVEWEPVYTSVTSHQKPIFQDHYPETVVTVQRPSIQATYQESPVQHLRPPKFLTEIIQSDHLPVQYVHSSHRPTGSQVFTRPRLQSTTSLLREVNGEVHLGNYDVISGGIFAKRRNFGSSS